MEVVKNSSWKAIVFLYMCIGLFSACAPKQFGGIVIAYTAAVIIGTMKVTGLVATVVLVGIVYLLYPTSLGLVFVPSLLHLILEIIVFLGTLLVCLRLK